MIHKRLFAAILILFAAVQLNAQNASKIVVDNDIQLIPLQDSVYVHISMHQAQDFGRFPSNGLIVIKNGEALMIDTPMDIEKTKRLTKYLEDTLKVHVTKFIAGHFHDDCIGGLEYLQSIGVESIANSMTVDKCKELGLPVPSTPFTDSLNFDFNGEPVECHYFGAGHSVDNITVWFPKQKILFGGCLIKAGNSQNLGNLQDAVVIDWDITVKKVIKQYPDVKLVVPGHGNFGGPELLNRTVALVENEKSK